MGLRSPGPSVSPQDWGVGGAAGRWGNHKGTPALTPNPPLPTLGEGALFAGSWVFPPQDWGAGGAVIGAGGPAGYTWVITATTIGLRFVSSMNSRLRVSWVRSMMAWCFRLPVLSRFCQTSSAARSIRSPLSRR